MPWSRWRGDVRPHFGVDDLGDLFQPNRVGDFCDNKGSVPIWRLKPPALPSPRDTWVWPRPPRDSDVTPGASRLLVPGRRDLRGPRWAGRGPRMRSAPAAGHPVASVCARPPLPWGGGLCASGCGLAARPPADRLARPGGRRHHVRRHRAGVPGDRRHERLAGALSGEPSGMVGSSRRAVGREERRGEKDPRAGCARAWRATPPPPQQRGERKSLGQHDSRPQVRAAEPWASSTHAHSGRARDGGGGAQARGEARARARRRLRVRAAPGAQRSRDRSETGPFRAGRAAPGLPRLAGGVGSCAR